MITYCLSNNRSLLQSVKEIDSSIIIQYFNNRSDLSELFETISHKDNNSLIIVISSEYSRHIDKIPEICNSFKNTDTEICIISRTNTCTHKLLKETFLNYTIFIEEKCIAGILFPEIIDPYSSFFAVRCNILANKISKKTKMDSLPDFLGKCNWNKIEEIQLPKSSASIFPKINDENLLLKTLRTLIKCVDLSIFAAFNHESHIWKEIKRALKFVTVGVSGTFVNTGVLFLLTEYAGIYYIFSSLIAIETSIVTNFLLNDFWTFGEKHNNISRKHMRFLSYQLVCTAGLLINITILFLLTNLTDMWYISANIIAIICVFIWNFLINRNITWKYKFRSQYNE